MQLPDRRTIATSIADNYESHDVAKAVLAQATATRRRLADHVRKLRDAYAVLGEQAYLQMIGQEPKGDVDVDSQRQLIDGLLQEIASDRQYLTACLEGHVDPTKAGQSSGRSDSYLVRADEGVPTEQPKRAPRRTPGQEEASAEEPATPSTDDADETSAGDGEGGDDLDDLVGDLGEQEGGSAEESDDGDDE